MFSFDLKGLKKQRNSVLSGALSNFVDPFLGDSMVYLLRLFKKSSYQMTQ